MKRSPSLKRAIGELCKFIRKQQIAIVGRIAWGMHVAQFARNTHKQITSSINESFCVKGNKTIEFIMSRFKIAGAKKGKKKHFD